MDVDTLVQRIDLMPGRYGLPSCLDTPNQRAYVIDRTLIRGFRTENGYATGTFKLADYDWQITPRSFKRWGSDGFSIINDDGLIIARWSLAIPAVSPSRQAGFAAIRSSGPAGDADEDGIPNAFEHLFVSSPSRFDTNPVSLSSITTGGKTMLHLRFRRRAGMAMPDYGYEISRNLSIWEPAEEVSESVLSTQTIDGVAVESVEARIAAPFPESGFVRLCWPQP
jgi:hypothetical protein